MYVFELVFCVFMVFNLVVSWNFSLLFFVYNEENNYQFMIKDYIVSNELFNIINIQSLEDVEE